MQVAQQTWLKFTVDSWKMLAFSVSCGFQLFQSCFCLVCSHKLSGLALCVVFWFGAPQVVYQQCISSAARWQELLLACM